MIVFVIQKNWHLAEQEGKVFLLVVKGRMAVDVRKGWRFPLTLPSLVSSAQVSLEELVWVQHCLSISKNSLHSDPLSLLKWCLSKQKEVGSLVCFGFDCLLSHFEAALME